MIQSKLGFYNTITHTNAGGANWGTSPWPPTPSGVGVVLHAVVLVVVELVQKLGTPELAAFPGYRLDWS